MLKSFGSSGKKTFSESELEGYGIYTSQRRTAHRSLFQILNWGSRTSWRNGGWFSAVVCLCIIAPFGALHLLAWDFDFPTPAEHTLWRVASVACVALPIIAMIMGLGGNIHHYDRFCLNWYCWFKTGIRVQLQFYMGYLKLPNTSFINFFRITHCCSYLLGNSAIF